MSAVRTHSGVSEAAVQTHWGLTSAPARQAFNSHQTEPFAETSTSAGRRACVTMDSASTLRVVSSAFVIQVTRHKVENVWTSTSASETLAWAASAQTLLEVFTVSVLRVSPWAPMDAPALTASLVFAMQSSSWESAAIPRPKWSQSQLAAVVELSFPMSLVGALHAARAQALAAWNTNSCAPTVPASPTAGTTSTNAPRSLAASVSTVLARTLQVAISVCATRVTKGAPLGNSV